MTASASPTRPDLRFDLSTKELKSLCVQEEKTLLEKLKKLSKLEPEKATFKTAILEFETITTEFVNGTNPLVFMKDVSTDEKIRNVGTDCSERIGQLFVEIFAREDLYRVLRAAVEKKEKVSDEEARLTDEIISRFKRNGLDLSPKDRAKFIKKKQKIVSLQERFHKRVNASTKEYVLVKKSELAGISDELIQRLRKTKDGQYQVPMDKATALPFLENASNPAARKRVEKKFSQLGGESNVRDLEEAIRLRHETATMLGYKSHAHFVLDRRMAKTPEAVYEFIQPLLGRLQTKARQELAALAVLKAEETGNKSAKIEYSDWRYYQGQLKKKKYDIDHQKIKEYFPLPTVLSGLFEIYQTLLDVKFEEVKDFPRWHESVQLFRIVKDGVTKGFFYMDLFPREGKYSHFAAFDLTLGYGSPEDSTLPVASIVGNFSPPVADTPSLLEHHEVETLFHEFGHIMHQTLTTARFGTFSGANVLWDFVEAPSQMLENWVWEKEMLRKLSGHYKNPKEKLPDAIIDRLLAAKHVDSGLDYARQAAFALVDLKYHTSSSVDGKSTKIYHQVLKNTMLVSPQPGTMGQASFGHLMGGYDAGYYGYLYSKVYAEDMFTRFAKEGLLSKKAGVDYRRAILEPGGSEEPIRLIERFLGRKPNPAAFIKSLGLDEVSAVSLEGESPELQQY